MRDGFSGARIVQLVTQATRWRARGSRQIWLVVLALAARLATLSLNDIPADVIGLVTAGKKIQAIKRYRELTGADLREAKAVIDGL